MATANAGDRKKARKLGDYFAYVSIMKGCGGKPLSYPAWLIATRQ